MISNTNSTSKTYACPIYGTFNGIDVTGFTLYTDKCYDHIFACSGEVIRQLESMTYPTFNHALIPITGSEISVVSPCALPSDDLRKNYKIKRGLDTGICNVVSPLEQNAHWRPWSYEAAIIPSKKAVVAACCNNATEKRLRIMISDIWSVNELNALIAKKIKITNLFFVGSKAKGLAEVLKGNLKKPCIPYTNLQINQENELTYDILYLVYKAGTTVIPDRDYSEYNKRVQAFHVELGVLNNYNWREYPGTMSLLFHELMYYRGSIRMDGYRSSSPKVVKNLLGCPHSDFKSEKDFNMGRQLVENLMGLSGKKFVHYEDLVNKLEEIHLSRETFAKLYKTITKIEENTFNEN